MRQFGEEHDGQEKPGLTNTSRRPFVCFRRHKQRASHTNIEIIGSPKKTKKKNEASFTQGVGGEWIAATQAAVNSSSVPSQQIPLLTLANLTTPNHCQQSNATTMNTLR